MTIKTMTMMMIAVHLSSVIYIISRKLLKLAQFLSRDVATYYDGDDDKMMMTLMMLMLMVTMIVISQYSCLPIMGILRHHDHAIFTKKQVHHHLYVGCC